MKIRHINICPEEHKNFCQFLYLSRLLSFLENTYLVWLFQKVYNQYNAARPSACLNINLLFGYNFNPTHNFYGINYNTQMDSLSKDNVRGAAWIATSKYYRALLIWQVCNEKKHYNKMICFNSNIPAFAFKNLERV